ncbi:hypothetical protein [Sphingomonas sp.]|uniref:hypothetical protein n=1 Tax=Sphingomonas sp. TaxID=28214 RepID=UPI003B002A2E
MSTTLTASFDTRREAEMTVERLVQQFGIERTDIFIATAGDENSAGVERAGSDTEAGSPSPEERDDSELEGRVTVSVDLEDEAVAGEVRSAFAEFDAAEVTES